MLESVFISITSAGFSGAIIVFLLKNMVQERIKQSIKNEYQEHIEILKNNLQIKSSQEKEIINLNIQAYNELGEILSKTIFEVLQLLSKITMTINNNKNKSEKDMLKILNNFFSKESIPIIKMVSSLQKYYVFLPKNIIENLQEFESEIWIILKQHKMNNPERLLEKYEQLIKDIRITNSNLLDGTDNLSNILSGNPKNGFIPKYIKSSLNLKV